ncbi:MAG: ABC transporter substrate-binding protein [Deinococcus sp.]|nr:ABC transporter substrate-binding protein [Deinococcus sp.]
MCRHYRILLAGDIEEEGMMSKRRRSLLLLLGVLVIAAVVVLFQILVPARPPEPIVFGVGLAITGVVGTIGEDQRQGVQLAQDFINQKQPGVLGRSLSGPLDLRIEDTLDTTDGAGAVIDRFINQDRVLCIIGPTLSQQQFSTGPVANTAGVPVIGPSNTAAGIPQIGEFIFRVSAPVAQVAPNALRAALNLFPNVRNVAQVNATNDAFSVSEGGTFRQAIADTGLNLAFQGTFLTTDRGTGFDQLITNILNNNPPIDLLVISGLTNDSSSLIQEARALGYDGPIVGGNGLNDPNVARLTEGAAEGMVVATAYFPGLQTALNQTFRQRYQERFNESPGQFPAQAFTAVQVCAEAVARVEASTSQPITSLDLASARRAIQQELLQFSGFETVLGPIGFTSEGEIIQQNAFVTRLTVIENPDGTISGEQELLGG